MSEQKGACHSDQTNRLNRIAGQVNGVVKMIEEQRYCIDILTQIKAIKSALARVEKGIIEDHINHCVNEAISSGNKNKTKKMIEEIRGVLKSSGVS